MGWVIILSKTAELLKQTSSAFVLSAIHEIQHKQRILFCSKRLRKTKEIFAAKIAKMFRPTSYIAAAVALLVALNSVRGHGGMLEPPMRSIMWRYGFESPVNYDWNALFCGGRQVRIYKYI